MLAVGAWLNCGGAIVEPSMSVVKAGIVVNCRAIDKSNLLVAGPTLCDWVADEEPRMLGLSTDVDEADLRVVDTMLCDCAVTAAQITLVIAVVPRDWP
jgi:hypothetical protein